jgi:GntR family transcriptional regulator
VTFAWNHQQLAEGPLPLWFQIADRLRTAVGRGEFAPGDRLPSETEISQELSVSRTTARAALDRLEHDGLIVRRAGKGSIVLPPRVEQPLRTFAGFADEMRARGLRPAYRTLSVAAQPAELELANALGVELGSPVVAIDRLLSADDFPMAIGRSWLSPHVLAGREPPTIEEMNAGSLYAWIEQACGARIVGGEEFLEAANSEADVAGRLEVPVGTATLVARRVARIADGRAVEFVILHYRADRYRFGVEWKRS